MVKFEFYLDEKYFDRMMVVKKKLGKDDLTFNEFAKELLQKEIYKLQPERPTDEEIENC